MLPHCFQKLRHRIMSLQTSPQCWPGFKKDIYRLEAVQRRFTKRLAGLHNMSYWDRLYYLNWDSLYNRRIKSDLLMTSWMGKWMLRVLLSFPNRLLKLLLGEMMLSCIRPEYTQHGIEIYFSNLVMNLWNSLLNHIVSTSSVGAFKRKLQNFRLPLFIT